VLGGDIMFDDLDRLQGLGVDAVLNLCAERADNRHQLDKAGIAYLWLPVMDVFPPTFDQIMQGMSWIERQLQDNRTIYIHCAVGVGRSATLLACWLLYAKRMTVSQALHFLKTRRPQVGLTRLQVRRLEEFEEWLTQQYKSHA
jgi:protein-tyrosine phosphatase